MPDGFDLLTTYIQLDDGPAARRIDVDPEFWMKIAERPHLGSGRLVGVFPYERDWESWEMHPAGDEVVYLLSGVVDMVLGESSGERIVSLRAGTACVVPAGVWHSANVRVAGQALHITGGAGTQHRPRERR